MTTTYYRLLKKAMVGQWLGMANGFQIQKMYQYCQYCLMNVEAMKLYFDGLKSKSRKPGL